MKARVKATGDNVEVFECGTMFKQAGYDYMDADGNCYKSTDLDFNDNTPLDYWTSLEHQYAGMAMQGLMSILPQIGGIEGRSKQTEVIDIATSIAHALVEKYKKEEK